MTCEHPDFVFVSYDGDMSSQTYDIAVSCEAGSLVGKPVKYIRHDINTRAVPDVPELVRYRIMSDTCAEEIWREVDTKGEYVLYSQSAEIIAAKDERLNGTTEALKAEIDLRIEWELRAEAAEAKLAQYEAQEPVACVYGQSNGDGTYSPQYYPHYPLPEYIKPHKEYPIRLLYASPAPAADLKAENDKLREALKPFARYMENNGDGRIDLNNKNNPIPDTDKVGWIYLTYKDFRMAEEAFGNKNA